MMRPYFSVMANELPRITSAVSNASAASGATLRTSARVVASGKWSSKTSTAQAIPVPLGIGAE